MARHLSPVMLKLTKESCMKQLLLFALLNIFFLIPTEGQKIKFETGTWEEVQEKAQATDRLIFLDIYTQWCKPCKWMEERVYTDSAVADYFNHHFVNYKIDAEKGVGKLLASRYHVDRYPTLLFLEASTTEIYNIVGYMDAPQFLEEAKKTTDPMTLKRLRVFQRKFDGGVRDKRFLEKYLKLLSREYKRTDTRVFDAWFHHLTLPDFLDSSTIKLLLLTIPNARSRAYAVGLDQYDPKQLKESPLYRDSTVLDQIGYRMHHALDESFASAMKDGNESLFKKLLEYKKTLTLKEQDSLPPGFELESQLMTLSFYHQNKKAIPFYNLANQLVSEYVLHSYTSNTEIDTFIHDTSVVYDFNFIIDTNKISDKEAANILYQSASGILDLSEDPTQLIKGIAWTKAALQLHHEVKYYPLLAQLTLKTGQPEEAISILRGAHQKAKASKEERQFLRKALMDIYNLQRQKRQKKKQ